MSQTRGAGNVVHEPVAGMPPGSRFRETWQDNGDIDMVAAYEAYYEVLGADSGVVVRPDHVPTVEGESNDVPGYHVLGHLFALGYLKGLMEAVQKGKEGIAAWRSTPPARL